MKYLVKAININADFDLRHAGFQSLANRKDFLTLLQKQKDLLAPIIQSDTALIIADRQLHLESMAINKKYGVFYLGSIHKRKIVAINENGKPRDFTTSAQDGLCAVMSLCVDDDKHVLWAGSSPMKEMQHFSTDSALSSAVYKYDLKRNPLIHRYLPTDTLVQYVFGAITVTKAHDVFIADSKNNTIFKVNENDKTLQTFFTSDKFWNIQGITSSGDGNYLFIADYIKRIFRLDLTSKHLTQIQVDFDLSLKSIDGLTFYKKSLIAIQNSVTPMRVTRCYLDDSQSKLVKAEIVDSKHPAFNEPTNGCLYKDGFVYIANSQWSGYDDNRKIKPIGQLSDIIVLRYSFDKKH